MDIVEYSKEIKKDAEALLLETKILSSYGQFGEVQVVGSYAANLMWDPDIDLVVVTNTPHEAATGALNVLAEQCQFQKIEFGDFLHHPRKNRPASFIVNARREWRDRMWEIETWFLPSAEEKIRLVEELCALPEESRVQIIEEKKKRAEEGVTKHTRSSFEIYQTFLEM